MRCFSRITIHQLYDMERVFHVNINVFELFDRNAHKDDDTDLFDDDNVVTIRNDENERDPDCDTDKPDDADDCQHDLLLSCKLIRRSLCHFPDTLNKKLFDKHLSYIFDVQKYCQSYKCGKYDSLWHNLCS